MRSTQNLCIIVTGCGSALGAATAAHFAKHGARVTICGRRAEKVQAVAESIGSACAWVQADIDDPADRQRILDTALEHGHGRVDVLVNNAGNMYAGPLPELEPDRILGLFQTNVVSPIALTQLIAAGAQSRGVRTRGRSTNRCFAALASLRVARLARTLNPAARDGPGGATRLAASRCLDEDADNGHGGRRGRWGTTAPTTPHDLSRQSSLRGAVELHRWRAQG